MTPDTSTPTPPVTGSDTSSSAAAVSIRRYDVMPSPVGDLMLVADVTGLSNVVMLPWEDGPDPVTMRRDDTEVLAAAREQLDAYFAGTLTEFDLPLSMHGSPFQLRVWEALREIPFGQTWSYGQLAGAVGDVKAARAVGAANGQNPVPIIVPCHRVIGANGKLVGYGGGLDRKQTLLAHEARVGVERDFGGGFDDG